MRIYRQSYKIAAVLKVSGVFDDGYCDLTRYVLTYIVPNKSKQYYSLQLEMRFFKYICNKLL